MPRHKGHYAVSFRPSVAALQGCGRLLIDAQVMSAFLQVSVQKVWYLADHGRVPPPIRLGLGNCPRWSVFTLLEWVAAGCPRRGMWIKQHGWSGWRKP